MKAVPFVLYFIQRVGIEHAIVSIEAMNVTYQLEHGKPLKVAQCEKGMVWIAVVKQSAPPNKMISQAPRFGGSRRVVSHSL